MNTILEALRELGTSKGIKKTIAESKNKSHRINESLRDDLGDLWSQVYSSLTDAGDNTVYDALGELNGKSHYDVFDVVSDSSRDDVDIIIVRDPDHAWAKHIAEIYGLAYDENGNIIKIYIPAGAPVNLDLIVPEYRNAVLGKRNPRKQNTAEITDNTGEVDNLDDDFDESFDLEIIPDDVEIERSASNASDLTEDVASSMPVTILPHDEVRDYIENIPETTPTRPPVFFNVGYIKELGPEIPAKFKGGRGSEGQPRVRIFKCSEMNVYTGADYENLGATKTMRKETGKERSGERTGFSFAGEDAIANRIGISARGEEQLQCYIRKGTQPKVKFFLSLDDEDLHEATKAEIAEYLTPAAANVVLNGRPRPENPAEAGQPIVRLKLSGIYRIGNLGTSVM